MGLREALHRVLLAAYHERDLLGGERRLDAMRRWSVRALSRQLERRPEGRIEPVDALERADPRVIQREYIERCRPVVLKGAALGWPAAREWSFAWFRRFAPDAELYIAEESFERSREGLSYEIELRPHTMSSFVDAVEAGERVYLKFLPLFKRYPRLLEALDLAAFGRWSGNAGRHPIDNELYMGGGGTVTHLHMERSDIFHACLVGRKRWRLHPPSMSTFLYPVPARTLFVASEVDFLRPDPDVHPWYRWADGWETVLEPGDVLYLPAWCWHAVENLEPVISANYMWYDRRRAARAHALHWLNGVLLERRGQGTIDQFVECFKGRRLPSLHG